MYGYIKFLVKDTWIAIPAFFIAIYYGIILSGNVIEYFLFPFFGKWSILVSLPLSWPYIYSPIIDEIMNFFLPNENI